MHSSRESLPVKEWGEIFCDQILVIGTERFNVAGLVAFAVEVVRVEGQDSGQRSFVVLVHEVRIGPLSVPRVKAVVTDHCKGFGGKGALILENVIKILQVN